MFLQSQNLQLVYSLVLPILLCFLLLSHLDLAYSERPIMF
jgi:hypothetical protein